MSVSKSIIHAAKKIVLNNVNLIAANKTNIAVCEMTEVGEIIGKRVRLSAQEIRDIELFFDDKLAGKLITYHTRGESRIEMARAGISEKSATGTVFQSLLSVASNAAIHLHDQPEIPAAARYIASITLSCLQLGALTHVVVLENGEMIVNWQRVAAALPMDWQHALLVYRGHGENQKDLKTLIDLLFKSNVKVALFFDYDPAGLEMAHQLMAKEHGYLVVPEMNIDDLKKLSKSQSYAEQHGQLNRLIDNLDICPLIVEHANLLKHHKLAVTQEHMITAQITLKIMCCFA